MHAKMIRSRQKRQKSFLTLGRIQYTLALFFLLFFTYHSARIWRGPSTGSVNGSRSTVDAKHAYPADCNETCIIVDVGKLAPTSPLLHGVSLEETDHGIEGGLFVELLADRSFEAFAWSKEHPGPSTSGVREATAGGQAAIKATADKITAATDTAAVESNATLQQLSDASKSALHAAAVHEQARLQVPWAFSSNVRVQAVHIDGGVIGHSIIVQVGAAEGEIVNLGHGLGGFPVEGTAKYALRMRVRSAQADVSALSVTLQPAKPATGKDGGGDVEALATYVHPQPVKQEWQLVTALLEPHMSSKVTKLIIKFKGPGAMELDWVSLIPAVNLASPLDAHSAGTSKHSTTTAGSKAEAGVEAAAAGDAGAGAEHALVDAPLYPFNRRLLSGLSELKPCFLRFPGAGSSATGLRWKGTVGPVDERPGHMSSHGPAYWSSDGIGLYEFMWLAEELSAEPVWVVSLGRGNAHVPALEHSASGTAKAKGKAAAAADAAGAVRDAGGKDDVLVPGDWLDDALDGLDFVLGPPTSRWGAVRAQMGRREPWGLKYVALESAGCSRQTCRLEHDRYARAIRARYPHIKLLAGGELGEGADFDIWEAHMLLPPVELFEHARRALDAYQGKPLAVPKWSAAGPVENVVSAVAEAGLLSALERNCAKVVMQSRSHVLGREGLRSWPNLLVFDAEGRLYRTPSFHVQKLYRQYMGKFCAHVSVVDIEEAKQQAATAGAAQHTSAEAGASKEAASSAAGMAVAGQDRSKAEAGYDTRYEEEEVEGTGDLEVGGLQSAMSAAGASPAPLPHPTLETSATCLDVDCEQLAVKVVNFGSSQRDVILQVWDSAATAAAAGLGAGKAGGNGKAGAGAKAVGALTKGRKWVVVAGSEAEGTGGGDVGLEAAGEDPAHEGVLIQLSTRDPKQDVNSLKDPLAVAPETRTVKVSANTRLSLPPYSLSVLVVDTAATSA